MKKKEKKVPVIDINPSALILGLILIMLALILLSKFFLPSQSVEAYSAWTTIALLISGSGLGVVIFYTGLITGRTIEKMAMVRLETPSETFARAIEEQGEDEESEPTK